MRLAFDIGNSAVKGGIFTDAELESTFRCTHAIEELSAALDATIAGRPVEWAGLASVVPASTREVIALLEERAIPAITIGHDVQLPFRMGYRTPETLGADRIAAAAAAWLGYGAGADRDVLALDAGTAVTCELVDRYAVYRGGTIAPGPVLMQRALNRATAQLPEVPLEVPDSVVGRSTIEAIQAGTIFGFLESVRGLLRRIRADLGAKPYVVATGGWSKMLREELEEIDVLEPHLVLQGVRQLVEMNR